MKFFTGNSIRYLGLLTLPCAGLSAADVRFDDRRPHSGIDFKHHSNPTPEKHLIETMGGGVDDKVAADQRGHGLGVSFNPNSCFSRPSRSSSRQAYEPKPAELVLSDGRTLASPVFLL